MAGSGELAGRTKTAVFSWGNLNRSVRNYIKQYVNGSYRGLKLFAKRQDWCWNSRGGPELAVDPDIAHCLATVCDVRDEPFN